MQQRKPQPKPRRAAPASHPAPGARNINRNAPHGFVQQRASYQAPGEGDEFDPYLVADLALTNKIAETLERHYPSHPWMVKVSHAQGVAMIKLPILMKRNEESVLHIDRLACDPGLRSVVRAGGEILERHNVPRAGFAIDHFLHAREAREAKRRPKPRLILGNEPPPGPRPRLILPS